jgi:hypothetical protein
MGFLVRPGCAGGLICACALIFCHQGFFKVTGIKPIEGDFQRLGILQNGGYTR